MTFVYRRGLGKERNFSHAEQRKCSCVTPGSIRFSTSPASCVAPRLHHASRPSLAFISGLPEFSWPAMKTSQDFLAPTPPRTPSLAPTPPSKTPSIHCSLFFPDCNASVHKGCRDSLPVCAKVKMKVSSCHARSTGGLFFSGIVFIYFFYSLFFCPAAQTAVYRSRFKHFACSYNEEQM